MCRKFACEPTLENRDVSARSIATQSVWNNLHVRPGSVTYFRPLYRCAAHGRGQGGTFCCLNGNWHWRNERRLGTPLCTLTYTLGLVDGPPAFRPEPANRAWTANGSGPLLDVRALAPITDFMGAIAIQPVNDSIYNWALSTRASHVSIYGPPDGI